MSNPDKYRAKAAALLEAAKTSAAGLRVVLIDRAMGYQRLAEMADKSKTLDLTYETPTPVAQQQQQVHVKNWLAGTSGPSGDHLVKLIRNSEYVLQVLLVLGGRKRVAAAQRLLDVRDKLAEVAGQLDAWISEEADPKLDPSPSP